MVSSICKLLYIQRNKIYLIFDIISRIVNLKIRQLLKNQKDSLMFKNYFFIQISLILHVFHVFCNLVFFFMNFNKYVQLSKCRELQCVGTVIILETITQYFTSETENIFIFYKRVHYTYSCLLTNLKIFLYAEHYG